MTTLTTPTTTATYSLSVPFTSTAWLQIELPAGLTDAEVLERITFQDTKDIEFDVKAIRCAVHDTITQRDGSIVIESN